MNKDGGGTEPQSQSRRKWAGALPDSAALGLSSRQRSARKPLGTRARRARLIAGRPMAACLLLLALSGCVQTRFVTAYCLSHDQQLPAEPEHVGSQLTGQAQNDFKIVAGSAVELRAWGRGLNTILEGCREPAK